MKRLIIIGAGGFGREILEWARACPAYRREWEIGGFLDDRADVLESYGDVGAPMLGNTLDYEPARGDCFVIAMGKPLLRALMRERFASRGAEFTRVIHESCQIGPRVHLDPGVVLCPGVRLTCDIRIGANTAININTAVGHDAIIGRDCQISSFCDITGYTQIGDQVLLGSRVSLIPGMRVGDRTVVGAGSVVVTPVDSDITVFGNPARLLSRQA